MGWFTQRRKDAKVGVIMISCELLIINEELFCVGAEYIQPCMVIRRKSHYILKIPKCLK